MIKGILWDNDGVLVNTEPLFYETNRQLFSEHDIELTQKNFVEWFLNDNCGAWHLLKQRGYGCKKIDELRQQHTLRYGMATSSLTFDPM
jgi:beta-phosphoglucomutase-like phosphatase (HAD superfamily)